MEICIESISSYKGFFLTNPCYFDGPLGLITGKNGTGKSRLLESITSGNTLVSIDNQRLDKSRIKLLDFDVRTMRLLHTNSNPSHYEKLAVGIKRLANTFNSSLELPDTYSIIVDSQAILRPESNFKVKEICLRAEKLFCKTINQLCFDELLMSLYVNREMINGATYKREMTLSQLTMDYYKALKQNRFLAFMNYEGKAVSPLNSSTITQLLGGESPRDIFNKIIEILFRGKFSISNTDIDFSEFEFDALLILNSTGEAISIENLSAGEKVIFWLAEKTFLIYYSSIEHSLYEAKLILIDEPDSHLHPQMILDFYECLKTLHNTLNVAFIFTTHSPTTVALNPNGNILCLNYDNRSNVTEIKKITKDAGISQLLEGVTQISINPDNQRQVYVENENDNNVYEIFYTAMKNKSAQLDPNIVLSFISSGPKIADNELKKHIESIYSKTEKTQQLIDKINGSGDCQQVIGIIEHLTKRGNHTVRGLIDWDCKQTQYNEEIIVFAKDYAYSIENVVYDPLYLYAYLTSKKIVAKNVFIACDEDVFWEDNLNSTESIQTIIDKVTELVLDRPSARNHEINYMNGMKFYGDREYFIPKKGENGHDFESRVLAKWPGIKRVRPPNDKKPYIYFFAFEAINVLLSWEFINSVFEKAFIELQK